MDIKEFKKNIRQGFNQASMGYDNSPMRFFDHSARHLVSLLPVQGDEKILDVATGTGKIPQALISRLPSGKIIAVDLSEDMLKVAQSKLKQYSSIDFKCMDIEKTQFDVNSFDGACCGFGVFFFPDMEKTLGHILSSLKPKAFFAMTSFAKGSFLPQSEIAFDLLKKYGVDMPESISWERLDSVKKHENLLKKVNLKPELIETKAMGYSLKNFDEWWDLMQHTGFRSFLNKLNPKDLAQYKKEHKEEIEAIATQEGIPLKVDVIFSVGKKG